MSYSGGGQCWPSAAEAAQAQCVAVQGVMSGAAVTCDGVVSVSESGAVLRYRFVSASGAVTSQDVPVVSAPCDYPTFTGYWGPIIAAAVLAVVTVRSLLAIRDMFKRESL